MIVTPGFRRRALVVALATIYGVGTQLAQANPNGAQVVSGQATLQTQGNKLTVTNTPGAIIHWQGFSIGAAETTYFQQQNAASAVLNRVQAQNPNLKSQIDGTLGSNGRVFLINPNGIVFGAGSVIDTQGFVASTLNLNDQDFRSGILKFAAQSAAGNIEAKGRISSGNGDVYLVAPNIGVDGSAVITSAGGNIVLAAGEMVEITGRNLNDIKFAIQSKSNQAVNLGTLSGGAVGVFAGTLSHSGVIQAQSLSREGGRLVLKGLDSVTLGAGSKTVADGATLGGTINVESHSGNVILDTGSLVSAQALSAAQPWQAAPRGGAVAIHAATGIVAIERNALVSVDGGWGGSVDVQSAKLIQDGAVHADGRDTVGGTIALKAESRLIQSAGATVSAQGVLRGGDVKLSVDADPGGSGNLFTSAAIDSSASSGVGGTVTITGRELTFAAARLAANGDAGGGTIRVGGGKAGKDTSVANAQNVVANGTTSFEANARVDGDGGNVIAWADGRNRFAGVLGARGGASGGNGGFIEVSGKEETQFGGVPNASAPHGKAGTFLLDPKYILIQKPAVIAGVSVELLDPNPGNNDNFGSNLTVFSSANGNILVLNPTDDLGGTNAGAVYLYDGVTGALISHLRGSTANDQVGSSGTQTLISNSKLAIRSPSWNNGAATLAGAITWFDLLTGASGAVSAANSLVGSTSNDRVGNSSLQSLGGGKFSLATAAWNSNAGAVTWVDSAAPLVGAVGAGNSLVGGSANDRIGNGGVSNFGSGKSLVFSRNWDADRGAVTWFDNAAGTTGVVSAANSLVGSTPGDLVSSGGSFFFGSKIVIRSPEWNNGGSVVAAGALTWADPGTALTGTVSGLNSLVGSNPNDRVGSSALTFINGTHSALFNSAWNANTGAVTWIDSTALVFGAVSSSNSLVGSTPGDRVGSGTTVNLFNGNRLIRSPLWNGSAGAVTYVNDNAGITGVLGNTNSLVGAIPGDAIGSGGVQRLNNSNYVVLSPTADIGGVSNTGAVTWGSGTTGISGSVGNTNSLVGTSVSDQVGSGGLTQLSSGNYLINSPLWGGGRGALSFAGGTAPIIGSPDLVATVGGNSIFGNGTGDNIGSSGVRQLSNGNFVVFSPNFTNVVGPSPAVDAGAITWGSSTTGFAGTAVVSNANSLVGTQSNDRVGFNPGSNFFDRSSYYLLRSPTWNGSAGAVTFSTGTAAITGNVDLTNSLIGSTANDNVGSTITFLSSNNYVVSSPNWDNTPTLPQAGAVTFGNLTTGVSGTINSTNSLVGSGVGDQISSGGITQLSGGNYLIRSPIFGLGAGAVTFAPGISPITGTVAAANGIFGSTAADGVGISGVTILNNGNFLVRSTNWNGGFGAVTWGDRTTGFQTPGAVSNLNSLTGTQVTDQVGSGGIQQLNTSNYLVLSPNWNQGGGAVSFASGTAPVVGDVSSTDGRSIVGANTTDAIGSNGIQILNNGNFVVFSPSWSNGLTTEAGAFTWGDRTTGFVAPGFASNANSLVGTTAFDKVGSGGITSLLINGNFFSPSGKYLVESPDWTASTGALTWFDQTLGIFGNLSSTNSLVGSSAQDQIGSAGIRFTGNQYLVFSDKWANIAIPGVATQAGAVTWADQNTGISGVVSSANSLVGSNIGDRVGMVGSFPSIQFLSGGLLLRSENWNGGRGALTFVPTAGSATGVLSAANSLVGATAGDKIGSGGIEQLNNNKFAVLSPNWSNGAATSAGAATWVDATAALSGFTGTVSAANSLVGSTTNDQVGSEGIDSLGGNLYALRSSNWDNGAIVNAGAITWVDSATPLTGAVSVANSLVGSNTNDAVGNSTNFDFGTGFIVTSNFAWNGNRGAVTWMSTAAPATGAISSANSLVGANPNDFVGNGGIDTFSLANDDYIVRSPSFGANSGALTIGSKTSGISGVVSGANSLIGFGTSFQAVNTQTRLLVRAANASSGGFTNNGRVCVYAGGAGCASSTALGPQLFANNASASVTITPDQITAITNNGTSVVLQANSDITLDSLSDIITNNGSGNGGDLTLQAGRSVLINSNIKTDNGNLNIIANERVSNGVSAADRDPGVAEITMANGTLLDAGTGNVSIHLSDGVGHSGAQSAAGSINLRSIAAGNLLVETDFGAINIGNPAATLPSEINIAGDAELIAATTILLSGGGPGAHAQLSANGQITFQLPSVSSLELRNGGSFARIVNPSQAFPIKLVVAGCIGCVVVSPFEITGSSGSSILDVITASLLSLNPNPLDQIEDTKESKGEIEVEAGETCK